VKKRRLPLFCVFCALFAATHPAALTPDSATRRPNFKNLTLLLICARMSNKNKLSNMNNKVARRAPDVSRGSCTAMSANERRRNQRPRRNFRTLAAPYRESMKPSVTDAVVRLPSPQAPNSIQSVESSPSIVIAVLPMRVSRASKIASVPTNRPPIVSVRL
jgi:hypothetical protein